MKNSMKINKIARVLCALQSVTNLGSKCNQTPPLRELWTSGKFSVAVAFSSHRKVLATLIGPVESSRT